MMSPYFNRTVAKTLILKKEKKKKNNIMYE